MPCNREHQGQPDGLNGGHLGFIEVLISIHEGKQFIRALCVFNKKLFFRYRVTENIKDNLMALMVDIWVLLKY